MRRIALALAAVGALAGQAPAVGATPGPRHFVVGPGSQVGYSVAVKTLLLLDERIEARDPSVRGDLLWTGIGSPTGWVEADVAGLDSGNRTRDGHVASMLGAPAQPRLRFDLEHLDGFAPDHPDGHVTAVGTLTAHGYRVALRVPLDYRLAGNQLRIDGAVPVHFRDFGIDPPVLGLVFKRAPDVLTLQIHLVATAAVDSGRQPGER